MAQSADVRPDPSYQRKAAIARGAALQHTGRVQVEPIPDFDLGHTIFQTLEGKLARAVMAARVGKEVHWNPRDAQAVQADYDAAREAYPLPELSPALLKFLVDECDFDVEHADGSFLDHLYFGFEYAVQHYPQHSAIPMFLHSILGTGTNTFAMEAHKIDALKEHLTDFEWTHVEAFPSVLRLLYTGELRRELWTNVDRADALKSARFHRVIDNAPIELSGEDLWIALNYQLIHLVDFLPVANWRTHRSDTSFILFRDVYELLRAAGKLEARVEYDPPSSFARTRGERATLTGWLARRIPTPVAERMAAKSVTRFSEQIGHDLSCELRW